MQKNRFKCVALIRIDKDGKISAKPINLRNDESVKITNFHPKVQNGSFAIIRIKKNKTAEIIKIFQQKEQLITKGVLIEENDCFYIYSIEKKKKFQAIFENNLEKQKFSTGDVVTYSVKRTGYKKRQQAKIIKKISHIQFAENRKRPVKFFDIALQKYEISKEFSEEALQHCLNIKTPQENPHQDKTNIEFITIDPQNAKDHDDAVCAEIKEYGYTIYVAIADVAYFVKKSDPIDKEARKKAFSIYFPNSVLPMLPEKISQNICSLQDDRDKLTILCTIDIKQNGEILNFKFTKARIRVKQNLTYQQAQDIYENKLESKLKKQINQIYQAWKALDKAKQLRQPLSISTEEITLDIDQEQKINKIITNQRLESHQVIEEFMITANTCASKLICQNKRKTLFRIHEQADAEKINQIVKLINSPYFYSKANKKKYKINDKPKPHRFNNILQLQDSKLKKQILTRMIVQAQAKACYSCKNIGHYGLQIENYTHFTSPIRRYADLTIHRIITDILDNKKIDPQSEELDYLAQHLSEAEIIAMKAERDTISRILIAHHAENIEDILHAYVVGIKNAGIFVKIEKTSAEAFIPLRELPIKTRFRRYQNQNQNHAQQQILEIFPIGRPLKVKVIEAEPINNSLVCKLV